MLFHFSRPNFQLSSTRLLRVALPIAAVLSTASLSRVQAATLRVSPSSPQPGDILTLTVYPGAGETISGLSMSAFDTREVKFYGKSDGTARGFVGLPFDRHGGAYTLKAVANVTRNGSSALKTLSTRLVARERNFPTQRISMRSSTASKMSEKAAFAREKARVQSTMKNSYPGALWQGSWIMPTAGASSSAYGRRRYVNGRWWGQHNGADVKAPSGTPVRAANGGRIVLTEYLPTLRGNCIVVDHGCNVFSIYMHLSKSLVTVGQSVGRGQVIGRVGATGFATGPHLHWEVRVGWEPVDPNHVVRYGLSF
ncbi:MAG TPA: M23 family metallopeptidase [Abditibacteriaceae bacterium]|jgi:murein DD-endopeptidase MepM/ murein hydrolase activator NlpD|nr:M23 family metallopeptidase [Abditibacteriaceae bacterium]